ncbi:MAG TPA: S8 family serine peptidase, partial [Gemmatimonadaceae bacterium]
SADDFTVISGILYAADHGADVINMSLGGYLTRTSPFDLAVADLMQRAVDYATQRGVLVVAAAGNESVNTNAARSPTGSYTDSLHTPAGGLLHVMSVGATGPVDQKKFDQIADYSNFGDADVAVFAPGGNTVDTAETSDLVLGACSAAFLPVCATENRYLLGAGTSFASPLVAGEAAVIKSHAQTKPTAAQLEACVLNTAFKVNGVRPDTAYGFGRIDVLSGVLSSSCQ